MEKKKRNRKQLISTENYINRLFLENSKLNVARFDLGYKKPFSNEITLEDANKDINKMLNNMRSKPSIFEHKKGYIIKREYTEDKGMHLHCVFFFDGNKILKDEHKVWNGNFNSGLQIPTRIDNGFKDIVESVFGSKAALPRDNIVKDFLISANEKFKFFKIADANVLSVLVIVWDDFIYEPISALKNDFTGLITEKSYFQNEGNPVKFEYIDNIILLRHMTQIVRSTVDILVSDGLTHPLDYGKRGITLPKSLLTVNEHPKKDILFDIFECVKQEDLEVFAEYKPQDMIMWVKTPIK